MVRFPATAGGASGVSQVAQPVSSPATVTVDAVTGSVVLTILAPANATVTVAMEAWRLAAADTSTLTIFTVNAITQLILTYGGVMVGTLPSSLKAGESTQIVKATFGLSACLDSQSRIQSIIYTNPAGPLATPFGRAEQVHVIIANGVTACGIDPSGRQSGYTLGLNSWMDQAPAGSTITVTSPTTCVLAWDTTDITVEGLLPTYVAQGLSAVVEKVNGTTLRPLVNPGAVLLRLQVGSPSTESLADPGVPNFIKREDISNPTGVTANLHLDYASSAFTGNNVAVSLLGDLRNLSSLGTPGVDVGHLVAIIGRAEDTPNGKIQIQGLEGRTNRRGEANAIPVQGLGEVYRASFTGQKQVAFSGFVRVLEEDETTPLQEGETIVFEAIPPTGGAPNEAYALKAGPGMWIQTEGAFRVKRSGGSELGTIFQTETDLFLGVAAGQGVRIGGGAMSMRLGGRLAMRLNLTGNDNGLTIPLFTLPAGAWSRVGDTMRISLEVGYADEFRDDTIQLRLNGQSIADINLANVVTSPYIGSLLVIDVIRTAPAAGVPQLWFRRISLTTLTGEPPMPTEVSGGTLALNLGIPTVFDLFSTADPFNGDPNIRCTFATADYIPAP